jgi:predicted DNA-binding protein with PD1-like motif
MGSFTTISSISQANPAVVTATHGFSTGDIILITNVSEMAQINTIRFQITVLSLTGLIHQALQQQVQAALHVVFPNQGHGNPSGLSP